MGKPEHPGKSDEPHGKKDEEHGKSDEPHGKAADDVMQIAAFAMQAIIASSPEMPFSSVAAKAVEYANALVAQLAKAPAPVEKA